MLLNRCGKVGNGLSLLAFLSNYGYKVEDLIKTVVDALSQQVSHNGIFACHEEIFYGQ